MTKRKKKKSTSWKVEFSFSYLTYFTVVSNVEVGFWFWICVVYEVGRYFWNFDEQGAQKICGCEVNRGV